MGENIGAAARVMANFGLDDLRIVNPRDGWPNPKALEMSAHAEGVIQNAKIFESLAEAAADLHYLYATTVRKRGLDKEVISPKEIVFNGKTGIVFGGERTGLENDEVALCDKIISIPVAEYKSINLAMSVGIICYQISQIPSLREVLATRQSPDNTITRLPRSARNDEVIMATKADMNSLFHHLENELDSRGFFQAPEKKPGMMQNIKNAFHPGGFEQAGITNFTRDYPLASGA